jgi:hypothetical protein
MKYFLLILLASCSVLPPPAPQAPSPTPSPVPAPAPSCEVLPGVEDTVQLGKIKLPATGKFFTESHLVTPEDGFGSGWPKTGTQNIDAHLKRSCEQIKKAGMKVKDDCSDVYTGHWSKVYTGSEGSGDIGNGARRIKPTVDCEPWIANMYWTRASFPPAYTRYLICTKSKSRCVVACLGLEVGPGLKRFAGAQTELIRYLNDGDTFVIHGRLKNQGLSFGPIACHE